MAFAGLVSLPDKQFEYLVENMPNYIKAQELPSEWIARDQIRKVVATTLRREKIQLLLQGKFSLRYFSKRVLKKWTRLPRSRDTIKSRFHF